MRVLVVIAHPRAQSFTHATAARFCEGLRLAGHEPDVLDLYTADFDPRVTPAELDGKLPPLVQQQQAQLTAAGGLALIYPLWWAGPPALLQGWLQRVLTQDFAFVPGAGGRLQLRGELVVNIGSRDAGQYGRYIEPMLGVLAYCGMQDVRVQANWGVYAGTERQLLERYLAQAHVAGLNF